MSNEPPAIQMLDDLLGNIHTPQNPVRASVQVMTPPQPVGVPTTNASTQAVPGTQSPVKGGPQPQSLPSVVPRGTIVNNCQSPSVTLQLNGEESFEVNLARLLTKDLELAQHDRAMAISLFQTHLDRAEVLDAMQLSMPVATVIGDNTGATLKSLELAMKAGERVHKVAELLVNAQKNGDAVALAALKVQNEKNKGNTGWGDENNDLPGG